jgi:small subunit ribosomal protein S1
LEPETSLEGTVISLTNFGAYVDVGTECDGLLHVSQMTRDFFVEHPRQVVTPGDAITVSVRSVNPERKKLHLTMLPKDLWEQDEEKDDEDRIPLDEIDVDDELWGEIKRVTDYGAYVELGAQVDGFLHFMDHPQFGANPGAPPSDFMSLRDRIRVWVSDVDMDKKRIKLTANRPTHLPGPRRDIY